MGWLSVLSTRLCKSVWMPPRLLRLVMNSRMAISGNVVVNMGEEHQLAPGEQISMGIREPLFDAVCGSCHGSVSGSELDVTITPDALTGASQSLSKDGAAQRIGP